MKALQQAKYDLVLKKIKELMITYGINNLKVSDIAKKVEVGEATIYRYFGSKTNLVIEVGVSLWEDIHDKMSNLPKKENGYEAVKAFFSFFLDGYKTQKEVFVFLEEFDSLMIKESVDKETLKAYDKALFKVKNLFDGPFENGVLDGTIKDYINKDEFYYTTTHMILGICKRLASNGAILLSDELVEDVKQIKMALDICLQYIKK